MTADKDGKDGAKERDEFWDIDLIIPDRKPLTPHTPPPPSEISFGGAVKPPENGEQIPTRSERNEAARRALEEAERRTKTSQVELEYTPDNSLIRSVRICRWPTSYSFYEKFLSDAQRYYRVKCDESPYVPFFSYLPQYNQMNIDQLRYYIWWRRGLRHGVYAKTDYSYIFLYMYELINLNTVSEPEKRLSAMCEVLLAYRQQFPKLDRYLGEWMCDFCLIHMLPPPVEALEPILNDIVSVVSLREFYMQRSSRLKDMTLLSFVKRNNNYRYESSSVCSDKTRGLFEKHLYAAVVYAIEKTQHIKDGEATLSPTRVSRASYNGALCVCEAKRRIDIDYLSLNQTYRFKGLITSFVKCAENGIRAALGIKSRLSTPGLSNEGIAAVNEYFTVNLPPASAVRPKVKTEEDIRYEYYDAQSKTGGFSHTDALDIERKSWELTGELVEEDPTPTDADAPAEPERAEPPTEPESAEPAESLTNEPPAEPEITENIPEDGYAAFCRLLSPSQLKFLRCIASSDLAGASEAAFEVGMLPDAVTDGINTLASDVTGDIIIENSKLIADYAEDIVSALAGE